MNASLGFTAADAGVDYNAFFLAGVLGDGELRHRVEHVVVVLPRSRQRHLLRDADLSDEPLASTCSARCCSTSLIGAGAGARSRCVLAAVLLGVPLRLGRLPLLARGGDRRHGRLVLLLRDLRAAHPAQRRVQHRDVDLLFRVPVRKLDVLPARAAAGGVPRGRATPTRSPGRSTCCATRRSASAIRARSRSNRPAFVVFTVVSFGAAVLALRQQE